MDKLVNRKNKLKKTQSWWNEEKVDNKLPVPKIHQDCLDMVDDYADYTMPKKQHIVRFEVVICLFRKLRFIFGNFPYKCP